MSNMALAGLGSVVVLGVLAQCLAWRLRVPAILLLLPAGLLVGPVTGMLQPDQLLGPSLLPLVSLSVAVLLFEGGLGLRLTDLAEIGVALRRLLTVGLLINWLLMMLAAHWLAGVPWPTAAVLAAVLVVTGPTVVGPIVRQVRPTGRIAAVLRWEGIVIDPLGAAFAVVVFEVAFGASLLRSTGAALWSLAQTLLAGLLVGLAAARLVRLALRRGWVPEYLESLFVLMVLVAAYVLAEAWHLQSGLLSATVMGVALANQDEVPLERVVEFKSNVATLLVSCLFVLLAARVPWQVLGQLTAGRIAFTAAVIVLARPLSVLAATWSTGLSWRERAYVALMAPRGIVAAAVSSVLALELRHGPDAASADMLMPLTFLVIAVTVTVYSLAAQPLARLLGVSRRDPQGFLIVGAQAWAREIALVLQSRGVAVVLVDSNRPQVTEAVLAGLPAYHHSILAPELPVGLETAAVGRLLALTSNDALNALACLHFSRVLGAQQVYQLATAATPASRRRTMAPGLRGRPLFGPHVTYDDLSRRRLAGQQVRATLLTEQFTLEQYRQRHPDGFLPLFSIWPDGQVEVFSADVERQPAAGAVLVALTADEGNSPRAQPAPDAVAQQA